MTFTAVVLAHQGGWDEMLMVVAPIALFVVLLRVANGRAVSAAQDSEAPLRSDPEDDRDPEDPR